MEALHNYQITGAWIVFLLVYGVLALGHLPFFRLDRTGAAFVGAVGMVSIGVLTAKDAFLAQDYETLALLFSMMVIVSFFVNSGILHRLEGLLILIHSPLLFLWVVILSTGLLSALFINDVICFVVTPIVLSTTKRLNLNPLPYLLAVAMASNIGSVMTPVGNPQNIFIASSSHISYKAFVLTLMPVSIGGLLILGIYLGWLFKGRLTSYDMPQSPVEEQRGSFPPLPLYVLVRTLLILSFILIAFWLGYPMGEAASAGAAFLLFTRRISRQRVFSLIDWDLLVLFVSLFVIVSGARAAGIIEGLYQLMAPLNPESLISFSFIITFLSNVVSNVPAVFFLGQVIPDLSEPESFWLLTAMVSTLAGNLTLIGSIANIIVAEKARGASHIGFWTYTKVGFPLTVIILTFALIYWLFIF